MPKTKTFNLKDLSEVVAAQFDMTQQAGAEVTHFILESVKTALAEGKQVRLHKFGTLEARVRAAGEARNPVNGARIVVPSRRVVKLTVSPALKAKLNG